MILEFGVIGAAISTVVCEAILFFCVITMQKN